ncbi:DUF5627 domain-containing protein [Desertivirga arenae]|uniref:DUF5627 domain-containing protein n=1 Tax=Desertivirga arenae TaxID=2810309 RepID=UPI001A974908|nr:DUF5627 domain-containing protein [Pedobacter sp. SYSU D00823]
MKKVKIFTGLVAALITATGCLKNKDIDHPDFDYQAVYFAYQYPVRTVVLGEDLFVDNTLDNERKVEIKATVGGTRDNKKDIAINFVVDNSLLNNLNFSTGGSIKPLPANYYSLASNQITIPKGSLLGGVQVQLTDAFFADPDAIRNTYALPIRMTGVQTRDSILAGKNFVYYALKFVNQWHGNYLRRGIDVMTNGATTRNVRRHADYVERDEVNLLNTKGLSQLDFPVVFKDAQGNNFSCTLLLTFDNAGKCTITTNTAKFTATGTGAFVKKGEKKSWGNIDRDALYLDYQVAYTGVNVGSGSSATTITGSVATKDTLVMRDRAVKFEVFTPVAQ